MKERSNRDVLFPSVFTRTRSSPLGLLVTPTSEAKRHPCISLKCSGRCLLQHFYLLLRIVSTLYLTTIAYRIITTLTIALYLTTVAYHIFFFMCKPFNTVQTSRIHLPIYYAYYSFISYYCSVPYHFFDVQTL